MSLTRICPSTAFIVPRVAVTPGTPLPPAAPVLRCTMRAGHYGAHGLYLSWEDDDAIDWPEAHDPDESFDVEVDPEPGVAARLDLQERYGDGPSVAPLDLRLEEHAASINAAAARRRASLEAKVDRPGDGPTRRCRVRFGMLDLACGLESGHRSAHSAE